MRYTPISASKTSQQQQAKHDVGKISAQYRSGIQVLQLCVKSETSQPLCLTQRVQALREQKEMSAPMQSPSGAGRPRVNSLPRPMSSRPSSTFERQYSAGPNYKKPEYRDYRLPSWIVAELGLRIASIFLVGIIAGCSVRSYLSGFLIWLPLVSRVLYASHHCTAGRSLTFHQLVCRDSGVGRSRVFRLCKEPSAWH